MSGLLIEATANLECCTRPSGSFAPAMGDCCLECWQDHSAEGLDAYQFVFDSAARAGQKELPNTREIVSEGRPLLESRV